MMPVRCARLTRSAIVLIAALLLPWVGLAQDLPAQNSRFSAPPKNPGPFDGVWQGEMLTRFGFCPSVRVVDLEIRGGKIRGQIGRGRNSLNIKANVNEDGKLSTVFASSARTLVRAKSGGFERQTALINWEGQNEQKLFRGRRPYFFDQDVCSGRIELQKVAP